MALQEALPLLVGGTRDIYTLNPMHAAFVERINFPLQPMSVLITVLCFIGMAGLYVFSTMMFLRGTALVPLKDPRLMESLSFENV